MVRVAFAFLVLILSHTLAWADGPYYIGPADIDLTKIIAPVPAPDSAITREDVRVLLDLQAMRTPELVAMANADVERSPTRFSDAAGVELSLGNTPVAMTFFAKVSADATTIMLNAKAQWRRIRPYAAFPEVKLVVPPESTFSYPSGHAAFGIETAILLAQMLPERAQILFERGVQFGFERALAGVHYPSDVEAGRLAGTAIIAVMMRSPAFHADFTAARDEVRAKAGLAPIAAVSAPQAVSPPLAPLAPAPQPAPAR